MHFLKSLLYSCYIIGILLSFFLSIGKVFITGGSVNSDRAYIIEVDTGILLYETR